MQSYDFLLKFVSFRRTVIVHNFAEKSKIMAINTSTITQLISDFRALSQKDSISPESLGVLLQRLADLINTAASDADYQAIYDAFQKFVANIAAVPTALYKLEQGSADRNDILMNVTTSHLINGITMTLKDAVFNRQDTTERTGAKRKDTILPRSDASNPDSTHLKWRCRIACRGCRHKIPECSSPRRSIFVGTTYGVCGGS